MNLRVKRKDGKILFIKELSIGDKILCEDGEYYPVRSILLTNQEFNTISLSNLVCYSLPTSWKLHTTEGFRHPKKNDTLIGFDDFRPTVVEFTNNWGFRRFHVILIDKRPVTPEGIAIDFGV